MAANNCYCGTIPTHPAMDNDGQVLPAQGQLVMLPSPSGGEVSHELRFWEIWHLIGETILDQNRIEVLEQFVKHAEMAQFIYAKIVAYVDENDQDGFELDAEFEDNLEPNQEQADDQESFAEASESYGD